MDPLITHSKRTLCDLPAECLLAIISHLPPASHTSLVRTSHHFLAFFSANAAIICNTYILKHYSLSASSLHSTYIDGWLVPSHPSLTIQENLLCSPPALHIFSEGVQGKLLLSTPGPQYLTFLTQYDFEIRTRREMADRELADLGGTNDARTMNEKTKSACEEVESKAEELRAEREAIEARFTYTVGTYAIRYFLRKLDDFAGALEERRGEEGRRRFDFALDGIQGEQTPSVGKKVGAKVKVWRKDLKAKLRGFSKRVRREKRELCFGELESDDEAEKAGFGGRPRDGVVEGLLWYYGGAGVLAFRRREEWIHGVNSGNGNPLMEVGDEAEEQGTKQKRVERVKISLRKALGHAVKVTDCFGRKRHFQSLD